MYIKFIFLYSMLRLILILGLISAYLAVDTCTRQGAIRVTVNPNYKVYYTVQYKSTLLINVNSKLVNFSAWLIATQCSTYEYG
jgi:hypothetical protein